MRFNLCLWIVIQQYVGEGEIPSNTVKGNSLTLCLRKFLNTLLLLTLTLTLTLASEDFTNATVLNNSVATMNSKVPTFKLLSGHSIPLIGLGTYLIDGKQQVVDVLDRAFAAGYRAFDTAAMYGNEREIGLALKQLLPKHNLKREDVFITTKLLPGDHGDKAKNALEHSLNKLDCGYLDLYLIHWPGVYGIPSGSSKNSELRAASWKCLVKAREEGLVKDIGVSNYTVRHLTELLQDCHGVKPVVNQVEWHPGCYEDKLREFCQKEGILVQAYMPLGGTGNKSLLSDSSVINIAKKLNKSPAQVLLKWCLQQNVAVIPKARSKEHMEANLELDFVIPDDDMATLYAIEPRRFDWDPTSVKSFVYLVAIDIFKTQKVELWARKVVFLYL